MTFAEVIKGAIPGADTDLCEFILWNRTPYPMGRVTARSLYQAASRWRRACAGDRKLCELCDNLAVSNRWLCARCERK
jgi:hypothetical protein